MRQSLIAFAWLLLQISCTSSSKLTKIVNEDKSIVYFVPIAVEKLLETQTKVNDRFYFELWNEDSCYRIFLHLTDSDLNNPWVDRSNRKIFVNKKLYPLVFDFDRTFAVTENGTEVIAKFSLEEQPTFGKKIVMNHGSYYVKFEKKTGRIIQSGYDSLK